MMRINEIPGQIAEQKAAMATRYGVEFPGEPPFVDDPPTHTVSLEGAAERRAAVTGILACDYTHPELLLLDQARIVMLAFLIKRPSHSDTTILQSGRPLDERLMASMYWTAHYADKIGSLSLQGIAGRDDDTDKFARFVDPELGDDEFGESLDLLQRRVGEMEEGGVFNDINPDHVHHLPLPEPVMKPRVISPGGGFHLVR